MSWDLPFELPPPTLFKKAGLRLDKPDYRSAGLARHWTDEEASPSATHAADVFGCQLARL